MVGAAVESVLAQSFRDFELVIVDDGSTDGTATRVGSIRLAVVDRCARREEGVSAARNVECRRSRGRYLAFLDSDDLWLPGKLARQTAFMIEPSRRGDLPDRRNLDPQRRPGQSKATHRKPSGDVFLRSLDLCLVSPSAVMMTRELFERVGGFDESLSGVRRLRSMAAHRRVSGRFH